MAVQLKTRHCKKCGRTMSAKEFYGTNNLEKYPDGKLNTCKKCTTMHVNHNDPDTFIWILQECDVPYIPYVWQQTIDRYGSGKVTPMTIVGRYLSAMKLIQHKNERFADTERLIKKYEQEMHEAMVAQGYSDEAISEIESKEYKFNLPEGGFAEPEYPEPEVEIPTANAAGQVPIPAEFQFPEEEEDDLDIDLTDEDRMYLRLKWGKNYKPEEWVRLEQLYEEMMNSYDIQGAGHIDTLKLICKTSLKANQMIDVGDLEAFQKMSRAYDTLMKSGKFTAAQNKAEDSEVVDSVGELIEMCEKEGYIERYYIESPRDKVDLTIADMQRYTKELVENETSLNVLIEKAIRENAREEQAIAENDNGEIVEDVELSLEEIEKSLHAEDYLAFSDFLDAEAESDDY